jgi:hypothetical protein
MSFFYFLLLLFTLSSSYFLPLSYRSLFTPPLPLRFFLQSILLFRVLFFLLPLFIYLFIRLGLLQFFLYFFHSFSLFIISLPFFFFVVTLLYCFLFVVHLIPFRFCLPCGNVFLGNRNRFQQVTAPPCFKLTRCKHRRPKYWTECFWTLAFFTFFHASAWLSLSVGYCVVLCLCYVRGTAASDVCDNDLPAGVPVHTCELPSAPDSRNTAAWTFIRTA